MATVAPMSKGVNPVFGRRLTLLAIFKGYAHAVSGISTSVDVTGGLDTRLLVAALHVNGVDFETGVSGHVHHPDVFLDATAAASIDRKFHVTTHDVSGLPSELESTVESLDGLRAHILTQHRLTQYQRDRYERGVTLTLKGIGGELYRDVSLQPKTGFTPVDISATVLTRSLSRASSCHPPYHAHPAVTVNSGWITSINGNAVA